MDDQRSDARRRRPASRAPRLDLLGGVAAVPAAPGSARVELAGSQPRHVLAHLALARGRTVPRDELAEALWPGELPTHWAGALRGVITKVRSFLLETGLGVGEPVRNDGGGYSLSLADDVQVDVEEAAARLSEAERALADDDILTADRAATDAAELLRQPLLGAESADWLDPHRSALLVSRVRALHIQCQARIASHRASAAVEAAEAAIGVDPLDEESYRAAMAAYRAAGNVGKALRAYERCRRILGEELGTGPSEATEAAYRELLGTEEALGARPAAGLPIVEGPMVGRGPEVAALDLAWQAAREGRPRVVVVHGEAGAGKTRVVVEVARRAEQDGARVLYGRAAPEGVVPFEPVALALGRVVAGLDDDELAAIAGPDLTVLAPLLPSEWRRLGSVATRVPDRDGEGRAELFEAARRLIRGLCRTPTIWVIDDVQWADEPTMLLLRHLVHRLDDLPLLIIATHRGGPSLGPVTAAALADLRDVEGFSTLGLLPLGPDDVADLLRAEDRGPDPSLVSVLCTRTAGNPFYISQILTEARERGTPVDPHSIPPTVDEVIALRVGSLSPAAASTLRLASVIGTAIDGRLLTQAAGKPAHDQLDELTLRGLLVDEGDDQYAFTHAIVRDAVYQRIPRSRRQQHHRSVAEAARAIEGDDTAWAAVVSHHLTLAKVPGTGAPAAAYARQAGDHAMASFAYEQAVGHYERALHLAATANADPAEKSGIQASLGSALRRCGRFDAARAALTAALVTAREAGADETRARVVLDLVAGGGRGVSPHLADPERARLLGEALDGLGDGPRELRLELLAELSLALLLVDHDRSLELAAQAAELAGDDASEHARAMVATRLARSRPDQAAERLAETDAVLAADRDGHGGPLTSEQLARLYMWRLLDQAELGDRAGLDHDLAVLDELTGRMGQPYWRWIAASWWATVAAIDGDLDRAEQLAGEALDHMAGIDHPETIEAFGAHLLGVRFLQDRGHEMVEVIESFAAQKSAIPAYGAAVSAALTQGGRMDEARARLDVYAAEGAASITPDTNWSATMGSLAHAAAELGHVEMAQQLVPLLEPHGDRMVVMSIYGGGALYLGPYALHLGRLHAVLGDTEAAHGWLDEAERKADAFGSPHMAARARSARADLARPPQAANRVRRPVPRPRG